MAFPTGYSDYDEFVIQSSLVTADVLDFVFPLDLAGSRVLDNCRSDGGDIRVVESDGTTQLARMIEVIDTGADECILWVRRPGTTSSSANATLRVYWNGTDTEPASTDTYGSEAVWSDFDAAHLFQSGSRTADASGNSNTLTENGTITETAGPLPGTNAIVFSGSSTNSYCTSAAGSVAQYLVLLHIKSDNVNQSDPGAFGTDTNNTTNALELRQRNNGSPDTWRLARAGISNVDSSDSVDTNWETFALRQQLEGSARLIKGGVLQGTAPEADGRFDAFVYGDGKEVVSSPAPWAGRVGYGLISTTNAQSDDWVETFHEAVSDPSAFAVYQEGPSLGLDESQFMAFFV